MTSRALRAACATMLPVLLLLSCKSGKDGDAGGRGKGRVSRYAAMVAARVPFLDSRGGIASVSAAEQVELRTETSGRIAEILFRDGASVRKGAILVRLDDVEARAQRDRAAAKARLATATLARLREQVRVEAASAQQLEAAQADSAVASADLALAEVALEKTRVRAPFDGTAGLLAVSRGQWVQSGQKLTEIVSRSGLRLDWELPEGEALRLAPGRTLLWKAPASGKEGRATVVALDPSLDEATRTRGLRSLCASGCEALLPGMAVEVRLPADSAPTLTVSSQALTGSAKGVALFLYKGGEAVQTAVVPGRRSTESVEIISGISSGDTVLVPGASPPKPGAKVEIARLIGGGAAQGGSDGNRRGASKP